MVTIYFLNISTNLKFFFCTFLKTSGSVFFKVYKFCFSKILQDLTNTSKTGKTEKKKWKIYFVNMHYMGSKILWNCFHWVWPRPSVQAAAMPIVPVIHASPSVMTGGRWLRDLNLVALTQTLMAYRCPFLKPWNLY